MKWFFLHAAILYGYVFYIFINTDDSLEYYPKREVFVSHEYMIDHGPASTWSCDSSKHCSEINQMERNCRRGEQYVLRRMEMYASETNSCISEHATWPHHTAGRPARLFLYPAQRGVTFCAAHYRTARLLQKFGLRARPIVQLLK
jgi:hypothetical protein